MMIANCEGHDGSFLNDYDSSITDSGDRNELKWLCKSRQISKLHFDEYRISSERILQRPRRGGHFRPFYDRWRLIFIIAVSFGLWCAFTTNANAYAIQQSDTDSSSPSLTDGDHRQQDTAAKPGGGAAPVIVEHPLDVTVPKNDPVTLNCKATGKPQPQINWYKDGELLSTANEEISSHRVLLSTGALFFLKVQPGGATENGNRKNQKSDAGVYWCLARNQYGEARSKNASVRIAYLKDEFRVRPKNIQAIVGQEAILECSPPKGFPEPVITWKKDNRELRLDEKDERRRIVQPQMHQQQQASGLGQQTQFQQGAGIGNLIITDVDSSDAGFYTCVAKNLVGAKESSPARLTVYAKPKLVRKPENVTATLNEDVIIACKMDGDPMPVIQWRKKWVPAGANAKLPVGRASQLEGRGLRIERVMASDEGEYECSGKNPAGAVEASAYLTVYSPPVFTVQPKDRTVEEGSSLTVDCDAFGNPMPTKFWSKEGNQDPLFPGFPSSDRRMEVTMNGTLRIYNVHASDEGYYVCSSLNNIGSSSSKMYLKVVASSIAQRSPPPLILRGSANQTLPESSLAILPCTASGRTVPRLVWLKNGAELESDVRYTIDTSGALQLHDLRKSDSGIYTCRVYNDDGEDRWSASLTVAEHTNPDAVFLRMAEPSTLPSAPGRPHPLNVTESSAFLEWEIPKHTGASAIIGYRLHYFAFGSEKKTEEISTWISATSGVGDVASGQAQIRGTRYLVQRLIPATSYIFVVRADNQHGVSEPSPPSVVVRTKTLGSGIGSSDSRNVDFDLELARSRLTSGQLVQLREIVALNSTAVRLTWKIIQPEQLINGYYVRWQVQDEREKGGSLNVPGLSATIAVVNNLRPFTTYKFFVRPYYRTVEGTPSNMFDVTTKEAPPSMAPMDMQVRLMNLTTFRISWSPPPVDSINGILKGYEIVILGNESSFDRSITTSERAASVTLYRLIPMMTYRIKVAAVTNAGVGVFHEEESVTMDEATFRRHLAMDNGVDARSNLWWVQSWWFIALLVAFSWIILLVIGIVTYRHCKRSCCYKGKLVNGNSHRHNGHQHSRFGAGGLPFIKINDGSVAREVLWMDHQADTFYSRGSGGQANSTLLMNGSYGGGSVQSPPDDPAALATNFTASTFMSNAGCDGNMDEKRYTELNQMNVMANGGQFYQPPSTPIYHQVSPPSPTPYATTTLVMNAHRQRLYEQQQRADARLYPNSTLHTRNGQQQNFNNYPSTQQHLFQQLQLEQDSNGLKRATSLRNDQQASNNQLVNGISPPHTDVSYVSSSGGSGSGKLTQRNKQPVLFDFLPPPPAQPPPTGPPAGYESSSPVLDTNREVNKGKDKHGYYASSSAAGRTDHERVENRSTQLKQQAVPTPKMRSTGRNQQKNMEWKYNDRGICERHDSPPPYEQAMRYFEGAGACSPTQSDCTSRQVQVDDSPRTSCYAGCHDHIDPLESKRSSMLASLATSDDGDNMIHGIGGCGYGPGTSSCNSDIDEDQNAVDGHRNCSRRRFMRNQHRGRRPFFGHGETDFSERDDADDDDVDVDDVDEDDEDENDGYETHYMPSAEFTQALASRSLLNSTAGTGAAAPHTSNVSNGIVGGGVSPQYRSQPPMGISASTLLNNQHVGKVANNVKGNGGKLNSLPRHASASAAVVRIGNNRGKGPTDVV